MQTDFSLQRALKSQSPAQALAMEGASRCHCVTDALRDLGNVIVEVLPTIFWLVKWDLWSFSPSTGVGAPLKRNTGCVISLGNRKHNRIPAFVWKNKATLQRNIETQEPQVQNPLRKHKEF